ncbi:Maf family protein [Thiomicrospira sp. R3]|uniref:Maf family protein n=1 Tax=Thiomicrospira sp. R3 TaxID=3035472 RepID=UPI00259B88A4|nr:nucleoside triphosphate pyrophosphatase [Thiomicrospira sp. R3]WFE67983.1 Maf family protein [Thiomicrospira sp. R3]
MMTSNIPIILASSSRFRQQLLHKLGIEFNSLAPQIDESRQPNESIEQMVARLSLSKAQAVSSGHPNAIIIASDQTASLNGKALGKAGNYQAAFDQLKAQSGQCIKFYTGLVVYNPIEKIYLNAMDTTLVTFRQLSDTQIHNYLMAEKPYDCAGSFKSEGLGVCLLERIETLDPNALIGLPLIQLTNLLGQLGINLPITRPAAH